MYRNLIIRNDDFEKKIIRWQAPRVGKKGVEETKEGCGKYEEREIVEEKEIDGN